MALEDPTNSSSFDMVLQEIKALISKDVLLNKELLVGFFHICSELLELEKGM